MGTVQHQHSLIMALVLATLLAGVLAGPALAQSGCEGDPCVFTTPTPTPTKTPSPTPTPTYAPGTPTPTRTPVPAPGTPIVIDAPMPEPKEFKAPKYPAPTSIPLLTLPQPNPNGFIPTPLVLTSPITASFTPAPLVLPSVLSNTGGTGLVTGTIGTASGWITETISYTTWLSEEIEAVSYTETFSILNAPVWYAPSLPRPMANVGWTFENMQDGIAQGKRYSLTTWADFAGYIASLPIQLIKAILDLFRFLGAFGLFVIWLLIMLPVVLFFKVFEFLKSLVIKLFNFILDVIRFILEIIKLLPFV
jgi:hypothetical protein